jgi:hypothetical protein
MEELIHAVLKCDRDTSIKHQLITGICKHATAKLSDSEARKLWKTFLSMCIHGPSQTHRSGARIVLDHLNFSHSGGRNGEIQSILQFYSDSGIDFLTASELLLTLNSVTTQKASDGWSTTAPMSIVEWFLDVCCTHATEWPLNCRIAIARIFCKEGLLRKIGASDGAGRLLDVALTWIVAETDMDDLSRPSDVVPLVVLVTALSRGLPRHTYPRLRPTCSD